MKRPVLLFLSLFMTMVSVAQSPLDVKVITLDNGFTVWLNIDHSQPKVFGAVVVKAGAKDCPNTGIAHYFEHLLFKGTDKIGTVDYASEKPWLDSISDQYDLLGRTHDAAGRLAIQKHINALSIKAAEYAIPNEFENLITTYGGSDLNAYTSFDETVFHNSFAPQYLAQWCELNCERLISPVFRLFQGELETVYEEKNMYADQMVVQAAEAVQRYALDGTPYAYPIIGSTDSLKNPSLSEMQRFYDQYYVAGNMGLMLCGDIQSDSLLLLLNRTFGRIKQGKGPVTGASEIRNLRGSKEMKVKVPIPIVKAGGYAFKAPSDHSRDYVPFMVMTGLLSNTFKTGLLDSLTHENCVLMAMAQGYDFKDFSVYGFGFVPNLPFGSRRQADRLCWEQVDKLRSGLFTDDDLRAEKLSVRRRMELLLENVRSRSSLMIRAFSHGIAWKDILGQAAKAEAVTRDDVVRVARTYFNNDSLKIVKKFGRYPKERIAQPGYKPVTPKNAGQRSAYAEALARQPFTPVIPQMVDVDSGAVHRRLAPLVNLYVSPNPMNDIANLQLVYRRGSSSDRRIGVLGEYLNTVGTSHRSKQQLGKALQQLGATLSVSSSRQTVTVTLSSFDKTLPAAMNLLHEFLAQPQANDKMFKALVKSTRLEEKSFFKDNANIADAMLEMVKYGRESDYLTRISARELKGMSATDLVDAFRKVQHSQLDVIYSGRRSVDEVKQMVRGAVSLEDVKHPWQRDGRQLKAAEKPVVYVYDNPNARQTIVETYQQLPPMNGAKDRTAFQLWGNYFGGGMSSVLFQDIREFRGYAYRAHGMVVMSDPKGQPGAPCAYVTRLGTQADKAMLALGVLDSLFSDMPVRPANLSAARQEMINDINNGHPSFRQIGRKIADLRLMGYAEDPNRQPVELLPLMGIDEVTKFYRDEIQDGKRAIIIVGNRKMMNLDQLQKLGRVVTWSASDVYKK
ncbi:MAG: insulinase family protein [Prevotella sp.]|nr:insulinase family protein [Prevotella sp.]